MINRAKAKVRRELNAWGLRGGPVRQDLYYRFLSEAFHREEKAVGRGISAYNRAIGSGEELFLLRRNVHMIEKGLTMKPRRDEFAAAYIERTVSSYRSVYEHPAEALGMDESLWMRAVLDEYFDATATARDTRIATARAAWAELTGSDTQDAGPYGPHEHVIGDPVPIDALTALARGRRSVRWFRQEPIPRELVDKAVAVAAEAPTACNRQPYRFEIFDDPASIQRVAGIPMGTRGYAEQLPGIIVIVGDLSAFFDERDRHLIYVDSCLAAMGLVLGLESQGVGSCCINWPDMPDREQAMGALLGLQPYERVVMLVAYGYPDEKGLVPFSAKRQLDAVRKFRTL